jgi:predicted HTH transcriptional regulator
LTERTIYPENRTFSGTDKRIAKLRLTTFGKSKFLEFKQDYSSSMLKSVSVFANEHDGWILFGVSDQGEVFGVTKGQQLRLKVENAINDNT